MTTSITEAELQAAALAPRVTRDMQQANIKNVEFLYHGLLTICVITLQNGFMVTGESACASPENYVKSTGEKISRENAEEKIWMLMGYELKCRLAAIEKAGVPTGAILHQAEPVKTALGQKVVHFVPMNRLDYTILRGWSLPLDENGEDEGYLVQYVDGGINNVAGFDGYISWSPRDVFEKSYSLVATPKVQTHVTRMQSELATLGGNITKLRMFTEGDVFKSLIQEERNDMLNQLSAMQTYYNSLASRVARQTQ
jgi:hypothetical protein